MQGLCLLEGRAVDKNHDEAFRLLEQASKSNVEAKILGGHCLEHGLGVPKNSKKAILAYQEGFGAIDSVEKKSPAAACVLTDEERDNPLFMQAVEEGSEHGLARLGLMYKLGKDVEQDTYEAIRLLLLAEKNGSTIAAVQMGKIYSEADGVYEDNIAAVAHLRRPAKDNFMPAAIELAYHYHGGAGVEEDHDESFRLFK